MLRPLGVSPRVVSSGFGRSAKLSNSSAGHHAAGGGASSGNEDAQNKNGVNVKVILRCRPLSEMECKDSSQFQVVSTKVETKEVCVSQTVPGRKVDSYSKTFTFDGVCNQHTSQQELFRVHIVPIVEEVLLGFNCTIFAYGQTGTGKTYTMEGDLYSRGTCVVSNQAANTIGSLSSISQPLAGSLGQRLSAAPIPAVNQLTEHAGIIPRSVQHIFERLEAQETEYSVRVSYLEIYNEELNDLLNDGEKQNLRIYEDSASKKGLSVDRLEELPVNNPQDIYNILSFAVKKRRTAETLLNRQSSRSHCIFSVTIHMKEVNIEGEDVIKIGKLNLVDLAGSENIQRSGANALKDRAKEAGMINQSLLTLGRVINALVERSSYIPYRDSKLTRLLQESLGGRTKTCVVATISPSSLCLEETLSTLDYAFRAKNIRNRPEVNQKMAKRVMIRELNHEIERLKIELLANREKNGVYLPLDRYTDLEARLANQETELTGANGEIAKVKTELETTTNKLSATENALRTETDAKTEALREVAHVRERLDAALGRQAVLEDMVKRLRLCESQLRDRCDNLVVLLNTTGQDLNALRSNLLECQRNGHQLLIDVDTAVQTLVTEIQTAATTQIDEWIKLFQQKLTEIESTVHQTSTCGLATHENLTRTEISPNLLRAEALKDEVKCTIIQALKNQLVTCGAQLVATTQHQTASVHKAVAAVQLEVDSTCSRILTVSERMAQQLQSFVVSFAAQHSEHQQWVTAAFERLDERVLSASTHILERVHHAENQVSSMETKTQLSRQVERDKLETDLAQLVAHVRDATSRILGSYDIATGQQQTSLLDACGALRKDTQFVQQEVTGTLKTNLLTELKEARENLKSTASGWKTQLESFRDDVIPDTEAVKTMMDHHRSVIVEQCGPSSQEAITLFGEEKFPNLIQTLHGPLLNDMSAVSEHVEELFTSFVRPQQEAWSSLKTTLTSQTETLVSAGYQCGVLTSEMINHATALREVLDTGRAAVAEQFVEPRQEACHLFESDSTTLLEPFLLDRALSTLPMVDPLLLPHEEQGSDQLDSGITGNQKPNGHGLSDHWKLPEESARRTPVTQKKEYRKGEDGRSCRNEDSSNLAKGNASSADREGTRDITPSVSLFCDLGRCDSLNDTPPTSRSMASVTTGDPGCDTRDSTVSRRGPRNATIVRATSVRRSSSAACSVALNKSRRLRKRSPTPAINGTLLGDSSTVSSEATRIGNRYVSKLPRSRLIGLTPQRRAAVDHGTCMENKKHEQPSSQESFTTTSQGSNKVHYTDFSNRESRGNNTEDMTFVGTILEPPSTSKEDTTFDGDRSAIQIDKENVPISY